jgi:hypothetical protein
LKKDKQAQYWYQFHIIGFRPSRSRDRPYNLTRNFQLEI